jgi:hypothetical protein
MSEKLREMEDDLMAEESVAGKSLETGGMAGGQLADWPGSEITGPERLPVFISGALAGSHFAGWPARRACATIATALGWP